MAPVLPQHQQNATLTNSGLSQQQQQRQQMPHHQRLSVDQSILNGPYTTTTVNFVPVSTSNQAYTPQQQQHQNVARINQSAPISTVNNSPSPSWQLNQQSMSPFSPQQNQNQHQHQHQHQHQQKQQPQTPHQRSHHSNPQATSPQLQHQLQQHQLSLQQQRSPSQSVSPPVTTVASATNVATSEPSPVVKKNPLLNAQLVNSRAPSITPTRFLSNQTNFLNQNPMLSSKFSHSPFINSNCTIGSQVNPQQQQSNRFVQHQQVAPSFNYDVTSQTSQQHHSHQHNPNQATGHLGVFGQFSDQHSPLQSTNQMYRTSTVAISSGASPPGSIHNSMVMGGEDADLCGNLSQQVKQEIRRKVQQPKQQQQTTSLLKQLLSDDNK